MCACAIYLIGSAPLVKSINSNNYFTYLCCTRCRLRSVLESDTAASIIKGPRDNEPTSSQESEFSPVPDLKQNLRFFFRSHLKCNCGHMSAQDIRGKVSAMDKSNYSAPIFKIFLEIFLNCKTLF